MAVFKPADAFLNAILLRDIAAGPIDDPEPNAANLTPGAAGTHQLNERVGSFQTKGFLAAVHHSDPAFRCNVTPYAHDGTRWRFLVGVPGAKPDESLVDRDIGAAWIYLRLKETSAVTIDASNHVTAYIAER